MEPAPKRQRLDYPAHLDHARGFNDRYTYYEAPKAAIEEDEYDDDMIDDDDENIYDLEDGYDPDADLQQKRSRLDGKLKSTFESIFEKYERDFDGIGDEIDLYTGTILVNNGHLLEMEDERDAGKKRKNLLMAFTAESEEEEDDDSAEDSDDSQAEGGEDGEEESDSDEGSGGEEEGEEETASDDAMLEDDIILRGIRPNDDFLQQREPSPELGSANQRFLKGYEEARPAMTPGIQDRNETPIESDIMAKFGPRVGPQVLEYISQQRLLGNDETNIEPAWRAPSMPVQPTPRRPTPSSRVRQIWDAPAIPSATVTLGRRPMLKSILAQPEIERTPSPEASNSIWAPEGFSASRLSVGPRKARCRFTAEDDEMIMEAVATARLQGLQPNSKSIWDKLELENQRHSANTWKKRYYDKFSNLTSSVRDDSELPIGNSFPPPRSVPKSQRRPTLEQRLRSASSARLLSPPRSVSQRPPRERKPTERNSGLVSWSDAVMTIQKDDPELHAGILEDVGMFEQDDEDDASEISCIKFSERSASRELDFRDLPEVTPMVESPAINTGLISKKSPSESSLDLSASPSIPKATAPPSTSKLPEKEVFQRNIVDPAHCFSDDDEFEGPRFTRQQQPVLTKPKLTVSETPPGSSLPPVKQAESLPVPNEEARQPTEATESRMFECTAKLTHGCAETFVDSDIAALHASSHTVEKQDTHESQAEPATLVETPLSNPRQPLAKTIPCSRPGCLKLFTNSWNLKSHLRTHERKDAKALEQTTTPARSAFLDWDDFDELSLGPDDFILVSSKSKSRRRKSDVPLAVRLKRESTAAVESLPNHQRASKELSVDDDVDVDDFDELAADGFAPLPVPEKSQPTPAVEKQPLVVTKAQENISEQAQEPASPAHDMRPIVPAPIEEQLRSRPSASSNTTTTVRKRKYSGTKVYEMDVNGITVMRRCEDDWLNATQILRLAGLDISQRHEILRDDVWTGESAQVNGVQKYQGTWIPFERGLKLCQDYKLEDLIKPLLVQSSSINVVPEALPPKRPTSSRIQKHKRKFEEMASDELPSQAKIVVEDSAAESSEISFTVPESSPTSHKSRLRRRRDTAGISPHQSMDLDRLRDQSRMSNLMVLVTPAKRDRRMSIFGQDRGTRDSSVVKTPGGTMRRCGLDGFRCERSFCFKCESPTKFDAAP